MSKRNKSAEDNVNVEDSKNQKVTDDTKEQEAKNDGVGGNEQIIEDSNIINDNEGKNELEQLKEKLNKKEDELKECVDTAQRVKAEFENFKKRTAREREQLYIDVTSDIIAKVLPIVDNLERAVSSASETNDVTKLAEGIEMTLKQFRDVLSKEGVEEIDAQGKEFDPAYHNAVMHIEDESYDENVVVEVFQKGYKIKDKVLRYSMVKVAN